jgi:hypothetical protein
MLNERLEHVDVEVVFPYFPCPEKCISFSYQINVCLSMFIENLSMPHYISYKVWEELNLQAIYNLQVMNTKAIGA